MRATPNLADELIRSVPNYLMLPSRQLSNGQQISEKPSNGQYNSVWDNAPQPETGSREESASKRSEEGHASELQSSRHVADDSQPPHSEAATGLHTPLWDTQSRAKSSPEENAPDPPAERLQQVTGPDLGRTGSKEASCDSALQQSLPESSQPEDKLPLLAGVPPPPGGSTSEQMDLSGPTEMLTDADDPAQERSQYETAPPKQSSPEAETAQPALPSSQAHEALIQREADAAGPAILDLKTACGFTSISRSSEANTAVEPAQDFSMDELQPGKSPGLQRQHTAADAKEQERDQLPNSVLDTEHEMPTAPEQNATQHNAEISGLDHDIQIVDLKIAKASVPSGGGKEGLAVGNEGAPRQPAAEQSLQDVQAM